MEIVYATSTMQVTTPDGGRRTVVGGSHWPASDPVVLAAPAGLFSPDPRFGLEFTVPPPEAEGPVEAATAAPGERRNVRRAGGQ